MADVPVWVWQVLGAVCGLGLGIWLGALRQRRERAARQAAASARSAAANLPPPAAPVPSPVAAPASPVAAAPVSPAAAEGNAGVDLAQQRLLQRLRESNIELSNKLRAVTESQSRGDLERNQQLHVEQQRHERQLEDLRQQHAQELSNLMGVLVQQVDGIHKEHAAQVRVLEAELERLRRHGDASPSSTSDAVSRSGPASRSAAAAPSRR